MTRQMRRGGASTTRPMIWVAVLAVWVTACTPAADTDDQTTTSVAPDSPAETPAQVEVLPSAGFVVLGASADGALKIEAREGSPESDIDVDVERVDPGDEVPAFEDGSYIAAFKLGPDGAEFDEPVSVTFTAAIADLGIEPDTFPAVGATLFGSDGSADELPVEWEIDDTGSIAIRAEVQHFSFLRIWTADGLTVPIEFSLTPEAIEMAVGATTTIEVTATFDKTRMADIQEHLDRGGNNELVVNGFGGGIEGERTPLSLEGATSVTVECTAEASAWLVVWWWRAPVGQGGWGSTLERLPYTCTQAEPEVVPLAAAPTGIVSTPIGIVVEANPPQIVGAGGNATPIPVPDTCASDDADPYNCAVEVIDWDHENECLGLDFPDGHMECWAAEDLTGTSPPTDPVYTVAEVCPGGSTEKANTFEGNCEASLAVSFDPGPTVVAPGGGRLNIVVSGVAEQCWQQDGLGFGVQQVSYEGTTSSGTITIIGVDVHSNRARTLKVPYDSAAAPGDRCATPAYKEGEVIATSGAVESGGITAVVESEFAEMDPAEEGPVNVTILTREGPVGYSFDIGQPLRGFAITEDDEYVYLAAQDAYQLDRDFNPVPWNPETYVYDDEGYLMVGSDPTESGMSTIYRVSKANPAVTDKLEMPTGVDLTFVTEIVVDDMGRLVIADVFSQALYVVPPSTVDVEAP